MRVIVCGAGRVGYGIARRLSREDNEVTIVDQSRELIRGVTERLDVRGVVGGGSYPDILSQAGAKDADMVIAVTHADEVNMVACQICHSLFKVPTKIARIRAQSYLDPTYSDFFSREHMPIDVIISPEAEVGDAVVERLSTPGALETKTFADGRIWAVGVRLREDCPIVETPLDQIEELFPDFRAKIVGVRRGERFFTPKSSDQLVVGDDVYFVAAKGDVSRALEILGESEKQARRGIIIGGGHIGLYVARRLEALGSMKIRLIERDTRRATRVAEALERTVVINGDGMSREILREAGVADAETVVALTDDDQVNVLSAIIAKRDGARRALSLINDRDYGPIAEAVGVDAFVDPRATTISTILQHVRKGRIKGVYSLYDGAAELLDAIALETSPLVGRPLKDAGLPDGVDVGAIAREGVPQLPRPGTVIRAGDRVILLALREHVKHVEQMFRVSLEYF